ncbi:MAG: ABC transporter ATP-binding protein/permease [Chloroflexi bacterium]|nr:ABC transporter ATP-binding protein/permease [Chloroflexota bacterium]
MSATGKSKITQSRRFISDFWPYTRPYAWRMGLALGILILDTLASLAAPWPVKLIFDNVFLRKPLGKPWSAMIPATVAGDRVHLFALLVAVLLGLAVINAGATYLGTRLLTATGQRAMFRLRCSLFGHLQQLGPDFYGRQRLGDLFTRLTSDIQSIQDMAVVALPMLLLKGLIVLGMVLILLVLNPLVGVMGIMMTVLAYLVLSRYTNRIKAFAQQIRRQEGNTNAVAQEYLLGIRVVQAFGMEPHARQRYEESAGNVLHLGIKAAGPQAGLPSALRLMTDMGTLAVMAGGGLLVMRGVITIGDLLVFSSYLSSLYSPVRQLGKFSTTFARASASAERLAELLHAAPAVADYPDAQPVATVRGAIEFRHVSFGYASQQRALHDLSFCIEPGTMVAIVGATGAGKSSILHLLQRCYDPEEGCILVDGRDIRTFQLASLRQQIALVPQDPMLFHTSVRENIAFGRPEATAAEVVAAASAAQADEFIQRLPQGYDTILEERGGGLSGGERQRLAIARAMIRRAPLLLLDEPTVGLDAQSEELVVRALERLMVGRTTLVVAHRLSTIRNADLVLVIDHGRIVEANTPAGLLATGGYFSRLHTLQRNGEGPLVSNMPDRTRGLDLVSRNGALTS